MRPTDRLFEIVLALGGGRVVTARALAERLAVSDRTIYRDIRVLEASGVPIDGEAGVGYRMRRGYQIPPLMFDEDELQALHFGADVARAWGDGDMARAAERAIAKIEAAIPERLRPRLAARELVVPNFLPEQSNEHLGSMRFAIRDRSRVLVDYRDATDTSTERIIWPLVLLYWGRTWTVGGWCELRAAFRSFRIDRIMEMRVLASRYPDEPGRRLADYLAVATHTGV